MKLGNLIQSFVVPSLVTTICFIFYKQLIKLPANIYLYIMAFGYLFLIAISGIGEGLLLKGRLILSTFTTLYCLFYTSLICLSFYVCPTPYRNDDLSLAEIIHIGLSVTATATVFPFYLNFIIKRIPNRYKKQSREYEFEA